MANYNEAYLGAVFLTALLSGDTTLMALCPGGVWNTLAPPEDATPFIYLTHQAEQDVITANAYRIFTSHLYQVAAVAPASNTSGVAAAAAQLDKLLGGPPNLPVSGPVYVNSVFAGQVLNCHREQALSIDELINTALWSRIGGMYRVLVQQNAS